MKNTICKKQTLFPIIGMALIYALQFLLFPILFPNASSGTTEAEALFIVPLVAFSVLVNVFLDVTVVRWAVADIIYCVLIVIYNGQGLYGIGERGVALDGNYPTYSFKTAVLSSIVIALALFLLQTIIRFSRKVFVKVKNKTA